MSRGGAVLLGALSLFLAAGTECSRPPRGEPRVVLEGKDGPVSVRVEIADREETRARGLMFRNHLPEDAGMLFVYPGEGLRTFWMKNTYIPLDIIFIGSNRRVVGVIENTVPLSEKQVSIQHPAQYILEVNAGFFRRHGLRVGTRVQLPQGLAW